MAENGIGLESAHRTDLCDDSSREEHGRKRVSALGDSPVGNLGAAQLVPKRGQVRAPGGGREAVGGNGSARQALEPSRFNGDCSSTGASISATRLDRL